MKHLTCKLWLERHHKNDTKFLPFSIGPSNSSPDCFCNSITDFERLKIKGWNEELVLCVKNSKQPRTFAFIHVSLPQYIWNAQNFQWQKCMLGGLNSRSWHQQTIQRQTAKPWIQLWVKWVSVQKSFSYLTVAVRRRGTDDWDLRASLNMIKRWKTFIVSFVLVSLYIGQIENVLSYLFFNDLRELVALFEMLCYIQSSFSQDTASNVMPRNPGDLCTVNVVWEGGLKIKINWFSRRIIWDFIPLKGVLKSSCSYPALKSFI